MRRHAGVIAALVLLVAGAPAVAQLDDPATHRLEGRVTDARGLPLRACAVAHLHTTGTRPSSNSIRGMTETLLNDTVNPGHGVITDPEGSFRMDLRPGEYDFGVGDPARHSGEEVCSNAGFPRRFVTHFEVVDARLSDPPPVNAVLRYRTNATIPSRVRPTGHVSIGMFLPDDLDDPDDPDDGVRALWRDGTSGDEVVLKRSDTCCDGDFDLWHRKYHIGKHRPEGDYGWMAWVEDASSGIVVSEVTTGTYTVDATPPAVDGTDPADDATDVDPVDFTVKVWTDPDVSDLLSTAHVYDVAGGERILVENATKDHHFERRENTDGEFDHLETAATYQLEPGRAYEVDIRLLDRAGNETRATIAFSTSS